MKTLKLEDLNVWYDQATLNIAVPKYMTDVNSIADLKGKGPEFNGVITGIDPGAGLTRITKDNAIPAYGLGGEYTDNATRPAGLLHYCSLPAGRWPRLFPSARADGKPASSGKIGTPTAPPDNATRFSCSSAQAVAATPSSASVAQRLLRSVRSQAEIAFLR
ncbi:glycine betaine ABC transporter substrate-binding protein [Saccharopolyspora phatthalungensis]|uniref:ABC-type glycine betaine transport system substrate-binding domain-containing protein n=1 Tax=Saccharopolyspora phatthalungensis TaxID=664693 RepID=A0A840Q2Q6_9PSEU|nr:glycine betaine ABC transporter substrate-binding protein [Saccharopolyspora phatthalungensis]MBB5152645.1 hypothetical protein [Saccharopolyspora phatthalungensis]